MVSRKKSSPKTAKTVSQKSQSAKRKPSQKTKLDPETVNAMGERLDMMLPEVMARIAAVEHVLVAKGICSHDDLRRGRKFIDDQESW